MTRLKRRIIFYLFVLAFFIGAPTVVLYTAGYRIAPGEGVALRAGGLAVSSVPRRAEILLDNEFTSRKTPHIFQQLPPNEYNVILQRQGFWPWSGEIEIEPGLTSYIQNILLIRAEEPQFLQDLPAREFSVDPTGRRIAYISEQGGWADFWIMDLRNGRIENAGRVTTNGEEIEISWSNSGEYVAWKYGNRLRIFKKNGQAINLQSLPQTIKQISWHPSNEDSLLIQAERTTVEVSMRNGDLTELEVGTLIRFDENRYLLARNEREATILILENENRRQQIAALPINDYQVFAWQEPFLILQNAQGRLISLNLQNREWQSLNARAEMSDWLPRQLLMLFTDGNEIRIFQTAQGTQEMITRLSSRIENIAWHPSGSRIFYSNNNTIYTTDGFKFTKERNLLPIANFEKLQTMWLSSDGRDIYIVGERQGLSGLFRLQIR